jgi:hypothetical protein
MSSSCNAYRAGSHNPLSVAPSARLGAPPALARLLLEASGAESGGHPPKSRVVENEAELAWRRRQAVSLPPSERLSDGTIKLPFRKLNWILSEHVGRVCNRRGLRDLGSLWESGQTTLAMLLGAAFKLS